MKKVILTAVISLLSLMSFAQFQLDPTIKNAISTDLQNQLKTKYKSILYEMDLNRDFFIYAGEARAHTLFDLTHSSSNSDTFYLDITGISFFESIDELDFNNIKITAGFEEIDIFSLQLEALSLKNTYQAGELDLSGFSGLTFLDLRDNPKLDSVCVHPNLVGNSNFFILIGTNTKVFTNNCQTEVYVCQNKLQFTKCPDPLSTTKTVSTSKELSLFPNPVKNELTFNLEEVSSVSVYSIDGVEVFTSNELVNNTIDLSSLPQGKYLVKLVTEDNVFSEMIIKE